MTLYGRVKGGFVSRRRHNKTLKYVKGFTGAKSKIWRRAHEAMLHSLTYAYRDRANRKREFRKLWIARINAASRLNGLSYSRFIAGLKATGVKKTKPGAGRLAVFERRFLSAGCQGQAGPHKAVSAETRGSTAAGRPPGFGVAGITSGQTRRSRGKRRFYRSRRRAW